MKKILAWLCVIGVHVSLWLLYWKDAPKRLWGDEYVYIRSAKALLSGDRAWWPEPLWPPLYTHFVAGLFWLSGEGLWLLQIAQTALLVVCAWVFANLAASWTGSKSAGFWAGICLLAYFPVAAFALYLWPEVLHLSLFLIAVWCLSERVDRFFWCGVAGLALGFAVLTKSLLGPFVPVMLIAAFWGDHSPRRVARIAVVSLVVGLIVLPVMLIQDRRLGRPMIADSSGFNLWVGLNDRGTKSFEHEYVAQAYEEYLDSGSSFLEKNAEYRTRSLELIRDRGIGEVLIAQLQRQYFRLFDKDNYLTEQLPGGAAARQKVGYRNVSPRATGIVRSVSFVQYAVLLGLAPFGYVLLAFRKRPWSRLMLVFLAYNLMLFLFLHVTSRYRLQIVPVGILGLAGSVALMFDQSVKKKPGYFRTRIVAASVMSLTLLLLAYSRSLGFL